MCWWHCFPVYSVSLLFLFVSRLNSLSCFFFLLLLISRPILISFHSIQFSELEKNLLFYVSVFFSDARSTKRYDLSQSQSHFSSMHFMVLLFLCVCVCVFSLYLPLNFCFSDLITFFKHISGSKRDRKWLKSEGVDMSSGFFVRKEMILKC